MGGKRFVHGHNARHVDAKRKVFPSEMDGEGSGEWSRGDIDTIRYHDEQAACDGPLAGSRCGA